MNHVRTEMYQGAKRVFPADGKLRKGVMGRAYQSSLQR
jgi:hypothetical protein